MNRIRLLLFLSVLLLPNFAISSTINDPSNNILNDSITTFPPIPKNTSNSTSNQNLFQNNFNSLDPLIKRNHRGYRWDYIEEKAPWSQWVERFLNFEENEENLEEITPLLLRLERWYHLPRDLNTLTDGDLKVFFWLSSGERERILRYREKNFYTNINELYYKDIIVPENYELIQPFIKIKRSPLTLLSQPNAEIRYGVALRAKELQSIYDSIELLKQYQLKIFGEIQVPGLFDFHYLVERDPNEINIFDLEKWSLSLEYPLISDGLPNRHSKRDSSSIRNKFIFTFGALKINVHQALLMATGYPLRKNERYPSSIKRNGFRLQSDKTIQEIFLKGQALDIHYDTWRLATWIGQYRYDDILYTNASDSSQLYAEGYSFYATLHRPFLELSLTENLIGIFLEKKINYHALSIAFLYSKFAYPIIDSSFNSFNGRSHWGISWGWDLNFNRYQWYGEISLLFNEKLGNPWGTNTSIEYRTSGGVVTGIRIFFSESDFFLSLRLIPPNYQAVHNLAYTRYNGNNEFGILGGFRLRPLPRLSLVSSFDCFRKIDEEPLEFGIDISQFLSYRHLSGYYNENQVRLRERSEWDDDYNYFWELRHRSGLKYSNWHIYGEAKTSGNLIEELIDSSNPFGLLLTLHGEYRYKQITTTVFEILWTKEGPRTLYDLLYHNRFFSDLLYLSRNSFIIFLRQELQTHPLFKMGFSVGVYWDDSEGKLLRSSPERTILSFFVNGEI